MRLRAILSAALVLLVLTISTWAPACDLFCSSGPLHFLGQWAGCEGHSAGASATAMNDMAMDGMAMTAESQQVASATDVSLAMALPMTACGHEPCSQTTVSVGAELNADHSPLKLSGVLGSPATDFTPIFLRIGARRSDEAPPKLVPLNPLGTTLRI